MDVRKLFFSVFCFVFHSVISFRSCVVSPVMALVLLFPLSFMGHCTVKPLARVRSLSCHLFMATSGHWLCVGNGVRRVRGRRSFDARVLGKNRASADCAEVA